MYYKNNHIVAFCWHQLSFRTNTHTHLMALCPELPAWAGTRKVKSIKMLLKQETVASAGPHASHSVFYRPDALTATQPTASKHWRQLCFDRSYHWHCVHISSTQKPVKTRVLTKKNLCSQMAQVSNSSCAPLVTQTTVSKDILTLIALTATSEYNQLVTSFLHPPAPMQDCWGKMCCSLLDLTFMSNEEYSTCLLFTLRHATRAYFAVEPSDGLTILCLFCLCRFHGRQRKQMSGFLTKPE